MELKQSLLGPPLLLPHTSQVPSWQFFYKPIGGGKIAVLLMNHDSKALDRLFLSILGGTKLKHPAIDFTERRGLYFFGNAFGSRHKI